MRRYATVFMMTLSLVSLPMFANALTHAGSYKVPLTPSFGDCGVEGSTTDTCSGSPGADLESDFIFDRGTVQIASNGRVGLKFDEIQIKNGVECPNLRCSCYGTNNPCLTDSTCNGGANTCVVNDNTDVKVEIWAQGFWAADPFWLPDPCGDGSNADCVRRNELAGAGMTMCHRTFILEVKANQRGQVNQQSSDFFVCGAGSAPGSGTIRRIEVSINNESGTVKPGDDDFPVWKLIARPSWKPGINTDFDD